MAASSSLNWASERPTESNGWAARRSRRDALRTPLIYAKCTRTERKSNHPGKAPRAAVASPLEHVIEGRRFGQSKVDLHHLALAHLLGHVRRVHVELPVPSPKLVDRPVALAQQRIVDAHLVVPDCDVLVEALLNRLDVEVAELPRHLLRHPLHLPHQHPESEIEAAERDWHMAVEQNRIDRHARRFGTHPGYLVCRTEIGRAGGEPPRVVLLAGPYHDLGRLVPLEDVGEVVDRSAVHHGEMGHVGDVVDQFAAIRVDRPLDDHPVGPFLGVAGVDSRDRQLRRRRISLRIVPYEQELVLLARGPRLDSRLGRNTAAVWDVIASAVRTPSPRMERALDGIAL